MTSARIDAHHHLWNYSRQEYSWITESMPALQRDFTAQDLRNVLAGSGLNGAVAVQARQTLDETRWLLQLTATHPFLFGVLGWGPLIEGSRRGGPDEFPGNSKIWALSPRFPSCPT